MSGGYELPKAACNAAIEAHTSEAAHAHLSMYDLHVLDSEGCARVALLLLYHPQQLVGPGVTQRGALAVED